VVALACLGVAAARPAPLVLGLALVLLLSIPWSIAVVRHLASEDSPSGPEPAGLDGGRDHADGTIG
jgi:4-amino-4-deoxy-L-arabinose transferase-like glycosyltransferase